MKFYKIDNIDRVAIKVSLYVILSVTIIYALSGIIDWIPICLAGIFNTIMYILGVLKPLWVGLIIAYLLYPLVVWFNKHLFKEIIKRNKKKEEVYEKDKKREKTRTIFSILFTYVFILLLVAAIFVVGFFMIKGKFENTDFDNYITEITNSANETQEFLRTNLATRLEASNLLSQDVENRITQFVDSIGKIGEEAVKLITSFLMELANNVLTFILGLVLAFYIMADLDFFKKVYKETLAIIMPKRSAETINKFLLEVNGVVSKFIRGQLLDCTIIAVISMISLSLIGLEFSFIVGILIGIANVIPYFGAIVGAVIAVIVGLLGDHPITALYALIVMIIIQQFDGNVMAPKIIGKSVGLHPLFILMAVIIGAQFGFIGLVLAVPTAGVVKLILVKIADLRKVNVKE